MISPNTPPESIETARRWLMRSAENCGDPHAGRLLAELADMVGPRVSGPSRSLQRAVQRRDDALRRLLRERYAGQSVRRAAADIAARAARYADIRLKHDLAAGRPPIGGVELIIYEAMRDGARVPGAEQLREILGGKLEG